MIFENFTSLDYYYFILSILFFVIGLLVIRKDKSSINYVFSFTPFAFSLWALIRPFFNQETLCPFCFSMLLDIFNNILFFIAPLGVLFSAWMILYGSKIDYKSKTMIFFIIYFVFGLVLSYFFINAELHNLSTNLITAFVNLYMIAPLIVSLGFYYVIYTTIIKNYKVVLLMFGISLGIIGQIINAFYYYLNGAFPAFAFIIIIVGLLGMMLSFISLPKDEVKGETPS